MATQISGDKCQISRVRDARVSPIDIDIMRGAGEGARCSHVLDVVERGLHLLLQKFALFALGHQIVCKVRRGHGQSTHKHVNMLQTFILCDQRDTFIQLFTSIHNPKNSLRIFKNL